MSPEALFGLGELLRAERQVPGLEEVDARGGGRRDRVGAEGAPLPGGDACFLAEFTAGALQRGLPLFPAASGKEQVLTSVSGKVGAQQGHKAVRVARHDHGGVTRRSLAHAERA
ncbi:hypothetical protein GCM10023238_37180 [Streptomyces heliomycini]